MKKFKVIIILFSFLGSIIYAESTLLVKMGELFKLNFPSERLAINYYIDDYDKHLLSYYGQEYFPVSDEIVYYFKPLKSGNTIIKITRAKNGIEQSFDYKIEINDLQNNELRYESKIIKPKLAKQISSNDTQIIKTVEPEYEKANGLKRLKSEEIKNRIDLINKLIENNYQKEIINEGLKLLNSRLLKGVREDITYKIVDAYIKENMYDSAITEVINLSKYKDDDINKGKINFFIGKIYYEKDEFDSAVITLLKMISDYDKNEFQKDAYFYIGLSYIKLNNLKKAIENFKYVINNFNGTKTRAESLDALAKLYESDNKIRDYYESVNYYRILHKEYPDLEIGINARKRAEYIKKNYL